MSKQDTVIQAAGDLLGCPYVYGTWGDKICTKALRVRYASYRPSQKANTYKRCQQLRDKDRKSSCDGCKYKGKRAFDCRGFIHWLFALIGIIISGQSVGSQWSTSANWVEKGDVAAMPDLVCVVFIRASGKWKHVGLHVGGGKIIHCSVEVKIDHLGGERAWTHYAIPAGLYTADEIKKAHDERGTFMRTLKKGMTGEDVRALQEMLNRLGYNAGTADGIFGQKTEAAVKRLQADFNLQVDGIAGPATLELLAARTADPSVPELPEDDDELEAPSNVFSLTYEEAVALIDCLKRAEAIIEKAIKQ